MKSVLRVRSGADCRAGGAGFTPRPVSFLGRGSAVPGSGRCRQGPDRVPGADQVSGPGPVRAQVQPAFPLAPGQAAGYVQQPEPQQFRGRLAQFTGRRARWRKQASRFAATATIWVQATLMAQWRDGHRFSPSALACLTSFSTCTWERWRASSQAICPAWVLVAISW